MDTLRFDRIPQALKQRDQWVLWKTVERNGKPTKVPCQCNGREAKSNDPDTWSDFETACARFKGGGHAGIGYVFSHYDCFVGIDLDGCRDRQTGKVAEWARDVIKKLDSYSEVSPSGTGVKVFVAGKSPFDKGVNKKLDEEKMVEDKEPGIEMYGSLRFFATTGWRLSGVSPNVEKRDLYWLRERFWPTPAPTQGSGHLPDTFGVVERARKYVTTMPPAISGSGGHNQTYSVACVLVLGFGLPESQAMGLLREYNARCEPPWSEKELQHKIQSAQKETGERNYLRDASPTNWKMVKVPQYHEPRRKMRTSTLKEATELYLGQLYSGKAGLFELGLPDVDYALGGGVARGEVVILAGRPSHGKSAVALQCVHYATSEGAPSLVLSEEMSLSALGKRAIQYASQVPEEHWTIRKEQVGDQLALHFEKRAKCYLVESCGTADAAADAIRRHVDEHRVEVVAIDYAQLLKSKGRSRYEEITNTSILLRQVATECNVVLLLLCQLNRAIESRKSFMPMMADLRDTGQLEQDADVILFLCWPHRIDQTNDPHEYLVFVAKNRNRAINQSTVRCRFNPSRQRLEAEVLLTEESTHWTPEETF